jgi:hypothetical protein
LWLKSSLVSHLKINGNCVWDHFIRQTNPCASFSKSMGVRCSSLLSWSLMFLLIIVVLHFSRSPWSWCSSWLLWSYVLFNCHCSSGFLLIPIFFVFFSIVVVLCFIALLIMFVFYFAWSFSTPFVLKLNH